jgi:hypothetical protein
MPKHYAFTLIFTFFILCVCGETAIAQKSAGTSADKIKAKVQTRIENGKKKVAVEMTNGTKIKGNIISADPDSFTLAMLGSNQTSVIPYHDVAKVKGTGWPTSAKIAIGVAGASGATLIALYIAFQNATRNN